LYIFFLSIEFTVGASHTVFSLKKGRLTLKVYTTGRIRDDELREYGGSGRSAFQVSHEAAVGEVGAIGSSSSE
jgi:hypothetical protein